MVQILSQQYHKHIALVRDYEISCVHQLVYSSTCATYGEPTKLPITEETPQVISVCLYVCLLILTWHLFLKACVCVPSVQVPNPYGKAKKMSDIVKGLW